MSKPNFAQVLKAPPPPKVTAVPIVASVAVAPVAVAPVEEPDIDILDHSIETIEKFIERNDFVLEDLYNEIKGFFCGSVRSFDWFVQEVYVDTYAPELLALGRHDLLHHRYPPIELVGAEDNALMDLRDRIREIMPGWSGIFISDETLWMMGHNDPKQKKKY
jgi:hypothetical protein